jgi:hypothetical protein
MSYTDTITPLRGFGETLPREGYFLIPGRIPTIGRPAWPQWRETAQAIAQTPLELHQALELSVSCVFGYESYQAKNKRTEAEWADLLSIPTVARMTEALLLALRGTLYYERVQIVRLEIGKALKPALELQAEYGLDCRRGVTLVRFRANG